MRAGMLVNRGSRRGAMWARQLPQLLLERGIEVGAPHYVRGGPQIQEAARSLAHANLPLVLVGGGDGTIGAVAAHFVGSQTVLAILPLGTGNALARDLRIPATLKEACDIAAGPHERAIDLGRVGDRCFVNLLTAGVSTLIARKLNPEAKRRFGRLAYLAAVLRAYREARPFFVELTLDGVVERFPTLQIVVGSGRFHAGPFPISPEASIFDGKLSVYALRSTRRSDLVLLARNLAMGTHANLDCVLTAEVERGRIEAAPAVRATIDGEARLRTPLEFSVEAEALRVRVPESLAV